LVCNYLVVATVRVTTAVKTATKNEHEKQGFTAMKKRAKRILLARFSNLSPKFEIARPKFQILLNYTAFHSLLGLESVYDKVILIY